MAIATVWVSREGCLLLSQPVPEPQCPEGSLPHPGSRLRARACPVVTDRCPNYGFVLSHRPPTTPAGVE